MLTVWYVEDIISLVIVQKLEKDELSFIPLESLKHENAFHANLSSHIEKGCFFPPYL